MYGNHLFSTPVFGIIRRTHPICVHMHHAMYQYSETSPCEFSLLLEIRAESLITRQSGQVDFSNAEIKIMTPPWTIKKHTRPPSRHEKKHDTPPPPGAHHSLSSLNPFAGC